MAREEWNDSVKAVPDILSRHKKPPELPRRMSIDYAFTLTLTISSTNRHVNHIVITIRAVSVRNIKYLRMAKFKMVRQFSQFKSL